MHIKNGETYEDNYQRAAAGILGTCADMPETAPRQAAYRLITGVYAAVAAHAERVGFRPVPDVSFAPWEQQRDRQADVKTIRSAVDKTEALAAELYRLAVIGEACADGLRLPPDAKPGRTLMRALVEAGYPIEGGVLPLPEGGAEALQELADISRRHAIPITDGPQPDKEHLFFSRCVFEPEENWTAAAFDRLLDADGRLLWLCGELERRGYRRIDCKDGKRISLDYVRQYGKKSEPVKMSWANKVYAGIEVTFEELRQEPGFLWLRVPMFRTVLERAGELPPEAASFLEQHTKNCDGCRYCVQTDKTGTRPLAAVGLGGRKKCPYFPSFSFNWRALPGELARDMLAVLDAVEGLGL